MQFEAAFCVLKEFALRWRIGIYGDVRTNNVGRGLAPAASVTNILSICNVRTNQGFPLR